MIMRNYSIRRMKTQNKLYAQNAASNLITCKASVSFCYIITVQNITFDEIWPNKLYWTSIQSVHTKFSLITTQDLTK